MIRRFAISFLVLTLLLATPACADYARGMEYFRKAYAAHQAKDFNKAVKLVQSAIHEDPQNAQAYALAGDIYYDMQNLMEAKNAWEKAMTLNPRLEVVSARIKKLKLEKDVEDKMSEASESIFEIRMAKTVSGKMGQSPPREDPNLASVRDLGTWPTGGRINLGDSPYFSSDEIIEQLKSAYEKIGEDFNYYPKHKIIVLLYSAEEFAKIRSLPEWVAGLYDGKIRIPLRPETDSELKKIIWHEYTHSLVFDIAKGKCPIFLNEGLAEYEGGRTGDEIASGKMGQPPPREDPNLASVRDLGTWPTGGRINLGDSPYFSKTQKLYPLITYFLPENLNKKPLTLDADRFYSQSRLLVEYIIFIWGWDGMKRLLSSIGSGKEWPDCIRDVFRVEPLELEKRWMGRVEE